MWEEGQGDATRKDEECVQTLQQPFKCTVINSTDDWLGSTTCSFYNSVTPHLFTFSPISGCPSPWWPRGFSPAPCSLSCWQQGPVHKVRTKFIKQSAANHFSHMWSWAVFSSNLGWREEGYQWPSLASSCDFDLLCIKISLGFSHHH